MWVCAHFEERRRRGGCPPENSLYMCPSAVCLCFMVHQMFKEAFQQRMTSQRSSCFGLSFVWPYGEQTTHCYPSMPHIPSTMQCSYFLFFTNKAVSHYPVSPLHKLQLYPCDIHFFYPSLFLCLIHFKCRSHSFLLLFLLLSICLSSLLSLLRQS